MPFGSDRFGFFAVMTLSLFLIILKGSSSDGQKSIFSNIFTAYIDETAASVIIVPSQSQLSEINSLVADAKNDKPKPTVLNTIQNNSIVSRGTILTDILDGFIDRGTQVSTYTVQEGDTLSFIASDYGVSINSIIWANNLKNADSISPGMDLKIPPVTGVIHKVKKGDTIASIAKKYGVDEQKIISFNNLSQGEDLQIDEEIIVPDGKIQAPKSPIQRIQQGTAKLFSYLPDLVGYFIWPANGFDWGRVHGRNGVDLANSCGTPILAAADGTVTLAKPSGWNGGFGKFIKISHPNGTETLYAHTMQLLVSIGEAVSQGQVIALIGSTGNSTGCHVHFEVHGAKNPLAKY